MVKIKKVTAMEIIDSRGSPTVEAEVTLSDGLKTSASVPSGSSVGKYEAIEKRDNNANRFEGKGVLQAVDNINYIIAPALIGKDPVKQGHIDQIIINLDGTERKEKLGANAILAVSMAVCKAAAIAVRLPLYSYIAELIQGKLPQKITDLPTPTFNIINGGKHGSANLDFQEFHVVPATNIPYHKALQMGEEIYQKLEEVLLSRNLGRAVGDEGGFAPNLYSNLDAFAAIMEALRKTRYKFGIEVFLGLDVAASNFKREEYYQIRDRPTALSSAELIDYLMDLHREYRLLILEDPLSEDDWEGWKLITEKMGKEVLIVGDDLLVTHPDRLRRAIDLKACSAILVKPNQIGTISETLAVVKIAKQENIRIIISHRSGETNDTFIADFAVGVSSDYVKFGAPARGERVAKYNRLLHIERELGLDKD